MVSRYDYPMFDIKERYRQFVIDAIPFLLNNSKVLHEYGFQFDSVVKNTLINDVADAGPATLLDIVATVTDLLNDVGHTVKFTLTGYTIDNPAD